MSRKPTAVRLSDETKKSSRTKSSEAKRTPRRLHVPPESKEHNVFDQMPFSGQAEIARPPNHLPKLKKGIRWFSIFFGAVFTLLAVYVFYQFQGFVEAVLTLNPAMQWFVFGVSALAGVALVALILREILSISRLGKLSKLRQEAEQVLLGTKKPDKTLSALKSLYSGRADMRWHLDQLKSHEGEILDASDQMKLTEKALMVPLDTEAKRVIASAAKRISVVTALNPSPVLDIFFVGYQVLQMLRKIMAVYGGRPAFFGSLKLVRMIATNLAVTGGLALSDTLLQQFIGKGLAGRLSAKLGEGTVNGILATRIGLAAIDICRPMPFSAVERPSLKGMLTGLFASNSQA